MFVYELSEQRGGVCDTEGNANTALPGLFQKGDRPISITSGEVAAPFVAELSSWASDVMTPA
jgi:hypothetical protein